MPRATDPSCGSPVRVAASPSSVHAARAFAFARCADYAVDPDRCDAAELVISELVGNAVRHGKPPVVYDVAPDAGDLLVTVADGDPTPPGDGLCSGPDAEGGRGLFLVDALSKQWGWTPAGSGKQVWARV